MRAKRSGLLFATLAVLMFGDTCHAQTVSSAAPKPAGIEARRQRLKDLGAEEWEFEMRENPLEATAYGDYRYNDQIDDLSAAEQLRSQKTLRGFLARLRALDTAGFPELE